MTRRLRTPDDLSLDRLTALLSYDPDSGVFIMKTSRGRKVAGTEAGYINNIGYRLIAIDGKYFLAHRLAWFYVTRQWPQTEIDHINRNPADNRFANLRLCTRSQNEANSKRSRNRSGYRGVCLSRGKWQAKIRKDGRAYYLGRFETPEEAHSAYQRAAIRFHGAFRFIERPREPEQASMFEAIGGRKG